MLNRLFVFLAAISACICLYSCDVLDQYPHNAIDRDQLTDAQVKALYTGLYRYAQYKPGFNGYFLNDLCGGDFRVGGGSSIDEKTMIKDKVTEMSSVVYGPWDGYYAWLYQVNSFLQTVYKMKDTAERNEMLGVAHFFRALIYYNLITRWVEVPIMKEPYDGPIAVSAESTGWDFVRQDLEIAIGWCPDFMSKEYVSKAAAKALMARALLAEGKKREAAEYAEEVISDPKFDLAPYSDIFRDKPNKEEILTFPNLPEEGGINFSQTFRNFSFIPTPAVIDLFTSGDERTPICITNYSGTQIFYKYDSDRAMTDPIQIIRLAEMYLISAEGSDLPLGLERLNYLRQKRGLNSVNASTSDEMLNLVLAERRLELMGEGFRWWDLVRTGRFTAVTGLPAKYSRLPIPSKEIELNELLEQTFLWSK